MALARPAGFSSIGHRIFQVETDRVGGADGSLLDHRPARRPGRITWCVPISVASLDRLPYGRGSESSAKISSVCWPSAGTAPMRGAACCRLCGGSRAGIGPTGESTSTQRARAASCGWLATAATSFTAPLAMPACSRRSRISLRVCRAKLLFDQRFQLRSILQALRIVRRSAHRRPARASRAPAHRTAATRARSEWRSSPRHRRSVGAIRHDHVVADARALRNPAGPVPRHRAAASSTP